MKTQRLVSTNDQRMPLESEICVCVQRALRETGYPELRRLSVFAHEGHVALKGQVTTYYLKQIAQCVAMSIEGVEQLKNDLVVSETTDIPRK